MQLPDQITNALPPIVEATRVANRRGSTLWDVRTDIARYAVKLGYPTAATDEHAGRPWTALAPGREAAVLHHLGAPVPSGSWEKGTWCIQPWHEGPDLQQLWERHRVDGSAPSVVTALECACALANLHAEGWAHGDVQPMHFLIGPSRTHLIDLALAQGKPMPEEVDFPHRGCLVHYEAPELSRQVLEEGQAAPTQGSDVYGLGASLLMAARQRRAVIYPDDAPRDEQRQAVVEGNRRPVNIEGPFGELVEQMLAYKPTERPTLREVIEAMREML
ncbi:protein kinase domain-containing protein [Streptomyces sp. BH104]|uniref:protein kinase domain-containing protein n=1 Tax=Streptomyces sp. BH104 TaxID=3410407 RepID=UPI003BB5ED1D